MKDDAAFESSAAARRGEAAPGPGIGPDSRPGSGHTKPVTGPNGGHPANGPSSEGLGAGPGAEGAEPGAPEPGSGRPGTSPAARTSPRGIRAEGLGMTIAGNRVFDGIDLACEPGQVVALVGASGSGKTTLLNCLGMLQRPTRGAISVDGKDATGWRDRQRQRFWQEKAAFVYQDYGLIDEESLAYNVTLRSRGLLRRRPVRDARVEDVLDSVGLAGRARDRASVLSGGEKQRAGVARALYKRATYIFADEPTASLDAGNRRIVTELLLRAAAGGACVVIATHDEELANAAGKTYAL